MKKELDDELKGAAEKVALEIVANGKVASEIPLQNGGILTISRMKDDMIILHAVDVNGTTVYIGVKVG